MILTFMQTVKDEKSFKGRVLQKLPSHVESLASFSPWKMMNEHTLRRCSTKGTEVCSNQFCLTKHAHMSWVTPPTDSKQGKAQNIVWLGTTTSYAETPYPTEG